MLTFQEFSKVNRERCESRGGFQHALNSWSLSDWMTATFGELGEAANVAKKLNRVRDGIRGNDRSEAELRADLQDEIADTFIYLDLLAQSEGFNLVDAAVSKFNRDSVKRGCTQRLGLNREGQYVEPGPYEHVDRDGRIAPDRDSIH